MWCWWWENNISQLPRCKYSMSVKYLETLCVFLSHLSEQEAERLLKRRVLFQFFTEGPLKWKAYIGTIGWCIRLFIGFMSDNHFFVCVCHAFIHYIC